MDNLVNEYNKIIRWPKKPTDKSAIIKWLSQQFESNKKYSEKEVNKIIERHHCFDDIALLRRELISMKYLNREDDGSKYWKIN